MKIDIENVFIGAIRVCTKYDQHTTFASGIYVGDVCVIEDSFGYIETDSMILKENAKLLKVTNGGYVDLDLLNSFLDEIKMKSKIHKNGGFYTDGLVIGTSASGPNTKFVDESTLKPYKPLEPIKKPTIKKLKKTMLMDARVPAGIE